MQLELLFWAAWAVIAYTYIGFPILLALWARLRGRPAGESPAPLPQSELPRVAMVVAACNEEAVIASKLANTWALDYPADRFQLIIGSDGSTDRTAELLETCRDPRLKANLFPKRRGKISVLNDLMAGVDADIVVMSDANTMFASDAIHNLVRHFADPQVGCVSGELVLEQNGGVSGEGIYWKYEGWIKRSESRLGFLIGCNGGIFALRPHLYRPLPPSTIVEDFVLTLCVLEQNFRVVFDPTARATEPPCPSAEAEMVRKIRIGAGGFQALGLTHSMLHPRHGSRAFAYWGHKVLRWLVPLFFLAAAGANVGLAAMNTGVAGAPIYLWLLLAQLAGGAVATWAYLAGKRRSVPRWTRPISYFYLMNYALFCGFLRFLFRTQAVTWERAAR